MATNNNDNCVGLMQGTLVRPIARYPASVAQDDPLKVASNQVQTSLVRSVSSGDTLFTVSDASRIVPQMLLSIGSEIVSVSTVDASTQILSVLRGFDGTQPASHPGGSVLSANIVAWHHNALAAEITAIEQALGPNLSNVGSGSGSGAGTITNCAYIFSPQAPGGNLSVGLNVITLTPVPRGINGTNAGHLLYISGGTGTAESVAIGGGTAVSGAASGTVIVTCANAHSGAWTIGSATGGIQEAIGALPAIGGEVTVSCDATLHANVVSLGKHLLVKKLAGQTLVNMGAPYSILGSTTYHSWMDCVYTTDALTIGPASSDAAVAFPLDPGVQIVRAVKGDQPYHTQSYSCSSLWVQEDYNGAAGTPFAARVQLNCPNNKSSAGVAAVAAYTEMGANSGTIGMGVHGEATSYSPTSTSIALNAEGTYKGATPGGILYGLVTNLGFNNVSNTTMIGASIGMYAKSSLGPNAGGGVHISASVEGSHEYGLYVQENGGTFEQAAVFSSTQANASNIVLNNNSPASVGTTNILFRRAPDPLSAPTTGVTASISSSHASSNASAGTLKLATGNGAGAVVTALTADNDQLVTVANCIKTTPISVTQLPPAASSIGCWACVNDSSSNTVGSPVAGAGGAFKVGVFCSARGWIVVAN